jgi:hypothetical protein
MTVSLIAVVSLAIYGVFDSGVRVMKKVTRPVSEEDMMIFFEKFTRELQNSFQYKGIPFKGEKDKLFFTTFFPTHPELGGEQGIGRIIYSYPGGGVLYREEKNLSQIYNEEDEMQKKTNQILRQVTSLSFEYFGFDPGEKVYQWKEEWDEEETTLLPQAVKLTLTIDDGDTRREYTRTVSIPIAY